MPYTTGVKEMKETYAHTTEMRKDRKMLRKKTSSPIVTDA